ncbi:hypothetical protein [Dongia sp.]|uniref:hypothetical protein n=1 Tax=Dongia sp. TaxID=1977262 RepID=UPI0035B4B18F
MKWDARRLRALGVAICFAGAAILSACAAPASLTYKGSGPLRVTSEVWGYYQEYLAKQHGARRDGVFLVAMYGDIGRSARYSYCPEVYDYCTSGGLNVALNLCKEDHLDCVLFARGSQIVVPYEIIKD